MSIIIKKAPTFDETATNEEFKDFQFSGTYMHITDVQKGCLFIANKIIEAGIKHDDTKMTMVDVDILVEERTADIEFKNSNWHKSHIKNNRHHFHQLDECPDDYNLIDVIESLVDCVMAVKARRGQTAKMSTNYINPELLAKAFKNTIEMLENEIIVEDE
jgi:hypothetical protein